MFIMLVDYLYKLSLKEKFIIYIIYSQKNKEVNLSMQEIKYLITNAQKIIKEQKQLKFQKRKILFLLIVLLMKN